MRLYELRQPEVGDDVVSGENVNTIEGSVGVNFEVASSSNSP